jgi:hypothetical protein
MFTTTAKDEGHKRVKRSLNVSKSFPSQAKKPNFLTSILCTVSRTHPRSVHSTRCGMFRRFRVWSYSPSHFEF